MSRNTNRDTPEPFVIATAEPRRPSGRAILFAGVAGACALGAGLGLWARPGLQERQAALNSPVAALVTPPPARQLEIVVDDHPRLTGAPINVLPGGKFASAPAFAPAPQPASPPPGPPEGLMKARDAAPPVARPAEPSPLTTALPRIAAAFAGAKVVLTRLEHPEPAPAPEARPSPAPDRKAELARLKARGLEIARADAAKAEAHRAALAKAEAQKVEMARAEIEEAKAAKAAAARAEVHRIALAKAEAAKAEAHRQQLARAEASKAAAHRQELARAEAEKAAAHRQELARAEAAKAAAHRQELARADAAKAAAHRQELAREARAEKAEKVRLAKAEARAKAAQREEAHLQMLADAAEARKRAQLVRLAHAVARAVAGRDAPAPPAQAKPERKHGGAAARDLGAHASAAKTHKRHEPPPRLVPVQRPQHNRPEPAPPPAASGLMKVSASARCASSDPGQAIVCADPALSAADRQVARAYQGARAAGVPDAVLLQGQQRWLAARSAAAREAPWAVRDVYVARIAELNGQAREAQSGY